jgi:hypothetical protein
MPLPSFLASLHAAVSKLFMANPPPMYQFLFPQGDFTCAVSDSRRFLTNKDDRTLAKSCEIRRVSHFKDVDRVNHELVLIELFYISKSNTIESFIESERCAGEALQREVSSISPTGSSSASIPSLTGNGVNAEDTIFIPGTKTRENESFEKRSKNLRTTYDLLRTVHLSERCSVAQLLVMLNVIHDWCPNYTVLGTQCYWYAGTLCGMLKAKFGGVVTDNAEEGKAGKYKSIQIAKCIVQPEVLLKYDEAWKAFCDQEDQEQRVSTLE